MEKICWYFKKKTSQSIFIQQDKPFMYKVITAQFPRYIIVKFLRLFNLSYHVVSLCEIKLQSIKIIFEGGLSSCDLD